MAKQNLKFFKGSSAPAAAIIGAIWFDTENRLIKVKVADSGENMWQAYSGLQNADWDESAKALKLTKADGNVLSVNLSDVASASALSTLEGKFNTLNTAFGQEQGYIDTLQSEMDAVEAKAAANEGKLAGLSKDTVVAEIDAKVAAEAAIARAAEKANADDIDVLEGKVSTLETDNTNNKAAIEALQGAVGEGGSVDAQIKAAIEALDSPEAGVVGDGTFVDVTVKQVDGKITEVVVAENDIASANSLSSEVTRAQNAEAAINEKIGTPAGVEGVTAYSKDYTVGMDVKAAKDAAAAAQADIDAFMAAADTGEAAIDTLKEIQKYITDDAAAADALVKRVGANETAISTLNGDATTAGSVAKAVADAESRLNQTISDNNTTATEAIGDLSDRVDALEGLSAGTEITDIKGRLDALETEINTNIPQDIATAEQAAKTYADGLAANYDAAGTAAGLIANLDAEVTSDDKYATVKVSEVDGKLTDVEVTVTTGEVSAGSADALVTASAVKSYVDSQVSGSWTWEEFA